MVTFWIPAFLAQWRPVAVLTAYCPGGQAERRKSQTWQGAARVTYRIVKNGKGITQKLLINSCYIAAIYIIYIRTYSIHQGLESMNDTQKRKFKYKHTINVSAGIYQETLVSWYLQQQGTSQANNAVQWMVQQQTCKHRWKNSHCSNNKCGT